MATESGAPPLASQVGRNGRRILSVLVSLGLFVAAAIQVVTLIDDFHPESLVFKVVTSALALVAGVGTLLPSPAARTILTAAGIGGLVAEALWPPWVLLDTAHPAPAWIAFLILVLTGASIAAGWRERRLAAGRTLKWLLLAGAAAGWAVVTAINVAMVVVVMLIAFP
jgi:hypothetical protein